MSALLVLLLLAAVLGFLARRLLRLCRCANEADWGSPWLNRLDGLNRLFCRKFHRLRHDDLRLPERGGVLLASNHVSGLDPLLLIAATRRPLRFVIAREQYARWWLRWLFRAIGCIPLERGRHPTAALRAVREALARGEVVALFPQGGIRLDHEPAQPLKRGVALLARMTGAPVVPVRLTGVRGQGRTVSGVFLRSRARLRGFEPLYFAEPAADNLLMELEELLSGRRV